MRRLLPAALAGALALAGSAAAASPLVPFVHGTVVGGRHPLKAYASVTPPVELFGDSVKATVTVLADTKYIDVSRLTPLVRFSPYVPVAQPAEQVHRNGRLVEIQWSWTLRCLTLKCVPIVPPSNTEHVFHFPEARIRYLDADGKVAYTATARFPAVEALSQVSPGILAFLANTHYVKWQYGLAPPAVTYRVSPGLVFWIALVLAFSFTAAGLVVATRWAVRLRTPVPHAAAGPPPSSLERALALFFWAGRRGDETLQRKALERVAAELPFDVADLSEATREIAWSADTPEEDEVEAISERAGVPTHPESGTGE